MIFLKIFRMPFSEKTSEGLLVQSMIHILALKNHHKLPDERVSRGCTVVECAFGRLDVKEGIWM